MMCNDEIHHLFLQVDIEHLIRSGSDHAPLLISFSTKVEKIIKSFKFLNFWLKDESFMEVVGEQWTTDFAANPFTIFHYKLKNLKKALSQ